MAKPTPSERRLIELTRKFAQEDPRQSQQMVLIAHALFFSSALLAATASWILVKIMLALLAGLFLLRCFILYHDYLHGSILRQSLWAKGLFRIMSIILLTPKAVWQETHNYHHAHTAKMLTSHIGSYKMVNTETWEKMNQRERIFYRFLRHPLNMLAGTFTVFFIGMIIAPLLRNPKKNWDGLLVLVTYIAVALFIVYIFSFSTYFFALLFPQCIAGAIGAYLFYAQHNFPTVKVRTLKEWSYVDAALHSSSFMKMHPLMHWFSGNIGYHHIHHLNPTIPFYRLPEAMSAIPELNSIHVTSLQWRDIKACLSLKLWDAKAQQMVGLPKH